MRITTDNFSTLVRTMQFWNMRKRDGDSREPIHIPYHDLKHVNLQFLVNNGEISIIKKETKNGRLANYYLALKKGKINLSYIKTDKGKVLNSLTETMLEYLNLVSLKVGSGSTKYFNIFLEVRHKKEIRLFFIIDDFSGRIHTPVCNLKKEYRKNLLLEGEETASIDVVTMQPVLLGTILKENLGANEYSDWIDSGMDIYECIQTKANLKSRDEGKTRFFEILFSKADKRLETMFGNAGWIRWVNELKSREMPENPHTLEKQHSNLAFLLQKKEVQIMKCVWKELIHAGIVFLSVHDEIIVKAKEVNLAEKIFTNVMNRNVSFFKLSIINH
jgi:hypothetical protein